MGHTAVEVRGIPPFAECAKDGARRFYSWIKDGIPGYLASLVCVVR
jgi:hypothetical protein